MGILPMRFDSSARAAIGAALLMGMLLAAGFTWSWWPLLLIALAIFLAGTEIRVRAEDRLLAARFGESFVAYRSRVRAYIPFLH